MRYVRSAHFSYHNAHVRYIPTEKKERKEMEVIQTIDLCVLPEKCVADVNGFVVVVVCTRQRQLLSCSHAGRQQHVLRSREQ
jgi:hypothetical protein